MQVIQDGRLSSPAGFADRSSMDFRSKVTTWFLFTLLLNSQASLALCVKLSQANLRAEPSTKSAITWVVGAHTPLLEVERKGNWYKVRDVDGEHHWVATKAVTSKTQCLTIKGAQANLRQGPGSQYPLAEYPTANRYFSFEKLDSEDEWYQVRSASGLGPFWVHESLIWQALKIHSIGF